MCKIHHCGMVQRGKWDLDKVSGENMLSTGRIRLASKRKRL
jgi:hypothetical protein